MIKRTFLSSLVLLFGTLSYLGCGESDQESQTQKTEAVVSMNVKKVTLDVEGMTCSGCEYNVESALKKIDGVTKVKAAFAQHSAEVEFDPAAASVAQLVQAVNGSWLHRGRTEVKLGAALETLPRRRSFKPRHFYEGCEGRIDAIQKKQRGKLKENTG